MATDGWVCFYRKIEEWEWYKTPHMLHLFFHLIVKANHKDGKWQGMEVMRGQLITGRKSLSSETGISEQTIRTCLKRLEHSSEIVQKSTSKFSVKTILNYNECQTKEKPANQQPTSNQLATTTKECKNDKNIRKDKEAIPIDYDFYMNSWNDKMKGKLPTIAKITKERQTALRARLAKEFKDGK